LSIKTERKKAGLSQRKVAEALGVTGGAVSMWELGMTQPRPDKLVALADLFHCTVDELLRGDDK
jgi:transcriptional regulator with XRE-family HTH domain